MKPSDLYQSGRLRDAIAAAGEEVKKKPTDAIARGFLCEMLLVAGELERAESHLQFLAQQDAGAAPNLSVFRQLIRAEQARRQFYSDGRLPEFLGEPTPGMKLILQASIAAREGNMHEAGTLLAQAEEQRTPPQGECNGQPFDDLRDLDDFNAPFFEVLATNGKYFWIPMERVASLELHPPERPLDLIWRRAAMTVADGPDGEVFLPAIYAATYKETDERLLLGRSTLWHGENGEPVRGVGQRAFLIGEKDVPIMEIKELSVRQASE